MSAVNFERFSPIEIINQVIKYYKEVNGYKKTNFNAYYQLNYTKFKYDSKRYVATLKEYISKSGNHSYQGDGDLRIKRFFYKENVPEKGKVPFQFEFLNKNIKKVGIVKSSLPKRTDVKLSDLSKKVMDLNEEDILRYFEVIHYGCAKKLLKIKLKTNKEGFNVYNIVIEGENGKIYVGEAFALISEKRFCKGDDSDKPFIEKLYDLYEECNNDEIFYYTNSIYDFGKKCFKEDLNFPISFYTERSNGENNFKMEDKSIEKLSFELKHPASAEPATQPPTILQDCSMFSTSEQFPALHSENNDSNLFTISANTNFPTSSDYSFNPIYPDFQNGQPNISNIYNPIGNIRNTTTTYSGLTPLGPISSLNELKHAASTEPATQSPEILQDCSMFSTSEQFQALHSENNDSNLYSLSANSNISTPFDYSSNPIYPDLQNGQPNISNNPIGNIPYTTTTYIVKNISLVIPIDPLNGPMEDLILNRLLTSSGTPLGGSVNPALLYDSLNGGNVNPAMLYGPPNTSSTSLGAFNTNSALVSSPLISINPSDISMNSLIGSLSINKCVQGTNIDNNLNTNFKNDQILYPNVENTNDIRYPNVENTNNISLFKRK